MRRSLSGPLASGRIESGTSYKNEAQRVLVRKRHKLGTVSAPPAMQLVVHQLMHRQQRTPRIVRTSGEGLNGMLTVGVDTAPQLQPAEVAVLVVEALVVLLIVVLATGTAAMATSLGMPSLLLRRPALQVQHITDHRQLRAAMTTGGGAATAATPAVTTHTGAGGSAPWLRCCAEADGYAHAYAYADAGNRRLLNVCSQVLLAGL
mmetsp:Transcript_33025/g.65050  ORF Transcript_33025/g.65050 Transcript_33025/m.65050 type:complete len:205 (+) Transcript_33025:1413-2027(+)